MVLGALVDAGASLEVVRAAVERVVPDTVRLTASRVQRAGLHATKVDVEALRQDQPHRSWADVRALLERADLSVRVRDDAVRVFSRLAEAEGRVHGVDADRVHFHEVGAWDSIADVVGVCAGLHDLGVTSVSAGVVALGSGRAGAAHGDLPVPVPAVMELAPGWRVRSGGEGELATPTGMALVVALALTCEDLPELVVSRTGVGAGTRDLPGRPNVVRIVIGAPAHASAGYEELAELLANVDDLDPRVWPGVLETLLREGARDAWLTPITMKKGRPAHTVHVLADPDRRDHLRARMIELTSTIGVREHDVRRTALQRVWAEVSVRGHRVRVKVAHRDGVTVHATPEFDDVAALADALGLPVRQLLEEADAAAVAGGLRPGASTAPAGEEHGQ